jgi:hypothetical protein
LPFRSPSKRAIPSPIRAEITLIGLSEFLGPLLFGPLKLGRLIERHMKIEDAFGRLSRHHA